MSAARAVLAGARMRHDDMRLVGTHATKKESLAHSAHLLVHAHTCSLSQNYPDLRKSRVQVITAKLTMRGTKAKDSSPSLLCFAWLQVSSKFRCSLAPCFSFPCSRAVTSRRTASSSDSDFWFMNLSSQNVKSPGRSGKQVSAEPLRTATVPIVVIESGHLAFGIVSGLLQKKT